MKRRQLLKIILGLLGTLVSSLFAHRLLAQDNNDHAQILSSLARARIIFLGERHDQSFDHQGQLAILQALYAQNPNIAIALEMFQRPYQSFLDAYLANSINEEQLRQKTEFDQRWGYKWEDYAPIFRFAQANKLPLLAINVPTEITRKVASKGITALSPNDRQWIAPLDQIVTSDSAYRQYLYDIYQQHQHDQQGNSDSFDRFVLAQVLWDETMADAIASFAEIRPNYQILVLAGRGHIIYNYGIPSRVQRRLGEINMRSVFFGEATEPIIRDRKPYDYLWSNSK